MSDLKVFLLVHEFMLEKKDFELLEVIEGFFVGCVVRGNVEYGERLYWLFDGGYQNITDDDLKSSRFC